MSSKREPVETSDSAPVTQCVFVKGPHVPTAVAFAYVRLEYP